MVIAENCELNEDGDLGQGFVSRAKGCTALWNFTTRLMCLRGRRHARGCEYSYEDLLHL